MMIYDMGVADINDDGWLDVHTTNHHARPLILINQRNGRFADKVLDLHLGTDRGQLGAEAGWPSEPPALEQPGLYIYWDGNELVIRAHDVAATGPATGFVLMAKKRSVTTLGNADDGDPPRRGSGRQHRTRARRELGSSGPDFALARMARCA